MTTKPKSNLLALGSAAVFTVYAAGYVRTKSAAQLFASESTERQARPAVSGVDAPIVRTTSDAPARTAAVAAMAANATQSAKDAAKPQSTPAPVAVAAAPPDAPPAATNAAPTPVVAVTPAAVPSEPTPIAPAPSVPAPQGIVRAAEPAPAAQPAPSRGPYRDGVFLGWGTSRHGNIQASVEIRDGHIFAASISQCLTRYSCSWISHLPPQVIARQSPDVDFVSGATQSANAFYYAVVDALKQAK